MGFAMLDQSAEGENVQLAPGGAPRRRSSPIVSFCFFLTFRSRGSRDPPTRYVSLWGAVISVPLPLAPLIAPPSPRILSLSVGFPFGRLVQLV
eukprot:g18726.t1